VNQYTEMIMDNRYLPRFVTYALYGNVIINGKICWYCEIDR
jgi:hypothetical protein